MRTARPVDLLLVVRALLAVGAVIAVALRLLSGEAHEGEDLVHDTDRNRRRAGQCAQRAAKLTERASRVPAGLDDGDLEVGHETGRGKRVVGSNYADVVQVDALADVLDA